jgi:hypothetical protein
VYNSTIITLEPCALDAEFQHFIPRFNKILAEDVVGETEGDFTEISSVQVIFSSHL